MDNTVNIDNIDIYESNIQLYLDEYIQSHNIEDMHNSNRGLVPRAS